MSVVLAEKMKVILDGETLSLEQVVAVARYGAKVDLQPIAKEKVLKSRLFVDQLIEGNKTVYGITTGFGMFSNVLISKEDAKKLQRNLIMSHATGVGEPLAPEVVRAIMLLRANALAKGFSGIRLTTLETLLKVLNAEIIPVVPEKGSLGASGDLAPLSHMVLVLLGEGEAFYRGRRMSGQEALAQAGIEPVVLEGKEGLALINGTQVMTAIAALAVWDAEILWESANITAALSFEALEGILDAFDPKIHAVRPHQGQVNVAEQIRSLTEGSTFVAGEQRPRVQDAYALRCVAQVHGPSGDAVAYVKKAVETEMNSATDNPLIFPDQQEVLSGGNFHGQPLALAMDFLGIAVAELANIAERRLERLVNPNLSGLPAFLTPDGGLNSGFMIVQYSAASLVSENKILAHPASVDSIPSSANQEDHVSMGTIAARKARSIIENTSHVLGMELLAACQGVDLRSGKEDLRLGKGSEGAYKLVRSKVGMLREDRVMYPDIAIAKELVSSGKLVNQVRLKLVK
ncbi:histidine ammonia-lyase [Desulfosporosinus sp. BICA1-9]|uniref:histidine ammonia-lyase n=1 Tax=Desulfosporosinus sp. BICA1-9 TaxID=1531958 RepID=UPI00054B5061|nr:histidine ammonia-lyase [Desulfosporosinus sp. BICA1-9]KJS48777.1 MAG: histidine ammonia-lyase [Peptococcaceae bacterium BRH_c23]KJS85361.1 MAG: histidine ammonia-lyase [Desulfosporosinus sp. BICA1-9]HBW37207.1 histidine ammonia-lyase [Desulfosporosinus sp.]